MAQRKENILFAHSGGPTALINAIASTVYSECNNQTLYIAKNGVDGIINRHIIEASSISDTSWQSIANSPASSFGSSRLHLPPISDTTFYQSLFVPCRF